MHRVDGYLQLRQRTEMLRHNLLRFLLQCRADGKRVVGYGAAGKGNTLLNYCGIRSDLVEYIVDRNPYKHGRFTPGMRIPIRDPKSRRQGPPRRGFGAVVGSGSRTDRPTQLYRRVGRPTSLSSDPAKPGHVGIQRQWGETAMSTCPGCGGTNLSRVLDLSKMTAAQHFPLATEPVRSKESSNPLAMDLCICCGFAQLGHDDDTVTAELRRVRRASTAGEGTAR